MTKQARNIKIKIRKKMLLYIIICYSRNVIMATAILQGSSLPFSCVQHASFAIRLYRALSGRNRSC